MRRLRMGIMSLIPAAVLFGGAELYSTLAIQRAVAVETDDSGKRRYVMRIGRLPWSRTSITHLNSHGFPEIEFSRIGHKGQCTHVVFLGDSFTFGDGVDGHSSFVSLIRHRTGRMNADRCVRVFNLGERGTTIDKQALNLRKHFAQLQPDVVVLAQYQNDLTDLKSSKAAAKPAGSDTRAAWKPAREKFKSMNLNVVRLASYHLFSNAIQRGVHYDLLKHWSVLADTARAAHARQLMEMYKSEFASLKSDLGRRGIGFGVVILPSKFDLLAGRFPEERFFRDLAEEENVPYLSTFPLLDSNRDPYPFLMYDGHLNELGNRLIADAVFTWLFDDPALFPALRSPRIGPQASAYPAH